MFRSTWQSSLPPDPSLSAGHVDSNSPAILLFVIGGITMAEIKAAHQLSAKLKRNVFIGSTSLVIPDEFAGQLLKLGGALAKTRPPLLPLIPKFDPIVRHDLDDGRISIEREAEVQEPQILIQPEVEAPEQESRSLELPPSISRERVIPPENDRQLWPLEQSTKLSRATSTHIDVYDDVSPFEYKADPLRAQAGAIVKVDAATDPIDDFAAVEQSLERQVDSDENPEQSHTGPNRPVFDPDMENSQNSEIAREWEIDETNADDADEYAYPPDLNAFKDGSLHLRFSTLQRPKSSLKSKKSSPTGSPGLPPSIGHKHEGESIESLDKMAIKEEMLGAPKPRLASKRITASDLRKIADLNRATLEEESLANGGSSDGLPSAKSHLHDLSTSTPDLQSPIRLPPRDLSYSKPYIHQEHELLQGSNKPARASEDDSQVSRLAGVYQQLPLHPPNASPTKPAVVNVVNTRTHLMPSYGYAQAQHSTQNQAQRPTQQQAQPSNYQPIEGSAVYQTAHIQSATGQPQSRRSEARYSQFGPNGMLRVQASEFQPNDSAQIFKQQHIYSPNAGFMQQQANYTVPQILDARSQPTHTDKFHMQPANQSFVQYSHQIHGNAYNHQQQQYFQNHYLHQQPQYVHHHNPPHANFAGYQQNVQHHGQTHLPSVNQCLQFQQSSVQSVRPMQLEHGAQQRPQTNPQFSTQQSQHQIQQSRPMQLVPALQGNPSVQYASTSSAFQRPGVAIPPEYLARPVYIPPRRPQSNPNTQFNPHRSYQPNPPHYRQ